MRQWRLIVDSPMVGAYNMAVDEAIMLAVSDGKSLPTLRLYDWSPLCLSLGYGQRLRDADLTRIDTAGWQIVRRPTGGKAILHGNELTYSVAIPKDHQLAQGDVVESYRRISEALLTALRYLGLSPASEMQAKGNSGLGPVCFEVPSHYEITSGGKKLIGSAQVRRKDGILQHGTLPLSGDIALICDALAYPDEASREAAKELVRQRATTLEAVLGEAIAWETTAESLVRGFAGAFDLDLAESSLSTEEIDMTHQLVQERYAHADWTNKR
jgi:lipoate-protein ligase A